LDVLDGLRLDVSGVHSRLEHKLNEFFKLNVGSDHAATVSASASSSRRLGLSSLLVHSLRKGDGLGFKITILGSSSSVLKVHHLREVSSSGRCLDSHSVNIFLLRDDISRSSHGYATSTVLNTVLSTIVVVKLSFSHEDTTTSLGTVFVFRSNLHE
jgi:hypothetical protein